MQMQVNGTTVQVGSRVDINVNANAAGETMPLITFNGVSGPVHIYRTFIHFVGSVQFHMYGDPTGGISAMPIVKVVCPYCRGVGTLPNPNDPNSPGKVCPLCNGDTYVTSRMVEDPGPQ